jgi:hypothetical protein
MKWLAALLALALPASAQDTQAWEARTAVEAYYAAIDARDYATAYRFWGDDGALSGKTEAEFAAGFAGTARVWVFTGPTAEPEGAAGSIYLTVPVRIEAETADGTRQRFAGSYVMRKSEVEGAAAGWHIQSAEVSTSD